jgi:hypothetical protein
MVAALVLLAVGIAVPAHASAESTFVSRINASRANAGLPPLQTHSDLVDDARAWSQRMLEAGAISHNPNLGSVTTGWESLGENVGVGPDEGTLHDAFMGSPGHKANILGDYTHVGVGVVSEPDRMWVTVVFMKAAVVEEPPPPPATVEPEPQALTAEAPAPELAVASPAAVKASPPPVQVSGRPPSLLPFAA